MFKALFQGSDNGRGLKNMKKEFGFDISVKVGRTMKIKHNFPLSNNEKAEIYKLFGYPYDVEMRKGSVAAIDSIDEHENLKTEKGCYMFIWKEVDDIFLDGNNRPAFVFTISNFRSRLIFKKDKLFALRIQKIWENVLKKRGVDFDRIVHSSSRLGYTRFGVPKGKLKGEYYQKMMSEKGESSDRIQKMH